MLIVFKVIVEPVHIEFDKGTDAGFDLGLSFPKDSIKNKEHTRNERTIILDIG